MRASGGARWRQPQGARLRWGERCWLRAGKMRGSCVVVGRGWWSRKVVEWRVGGSSASGLQWRTAAVWSLLGKWAPVAYIGPTTSPFVATASRQGTESKDLDICARGRGGSDSAERHDREGSARGALGVPAPSRGGGVRGPGARPRIPAYPRGCPGPRCLGPRTATWQNQAPVDAFRWRSGAGCRQRHQFAIQLPLFDWLKLECFQPNSKIFE
jgi:hypothetical protein